jgi:protein-L-isoaspartate(D-aspartate) O-methyltransferase
MEKDNLIFKGKRLQLVDNLRQKGILDERVLSAINEIRRHMFMDQGLIDYAYVDSAFPIAAGQTISQPYTVARQTELIDFEEGMKVLEIGTGSGYQAAILYKLGLKVFSIERQRELYEKALTILRNEGYYPQLFFGDGYKGLPTYGPFHRILITAAASEIPSKLLAQLLINGKMVLPIGAGSHQIMTRITRNSENDFSTEEFGNYSFVPMLHGTNRG